jgi:hypothetical protein
MAAGVAADQVSLVEGGAVTWADAPGTAAAAAFDPAVEVTIHVPAGSDTAATAARVREAVEPDLPVFSQLSIRVEES